MKLEELMNLVGDNDSADSPKPSKRARREELIDRHTRETLRDVNRDLAAQFGSTAQAHRELDRLSTAAASLAMADTEMSDGLPESVKAIVNAPDPDLLGIHSAPAKTAAELFAESDLFAMERYAAKANMLEESIGALGGVSSQVAEMLGGLDRASLGLESAIPRDLVNPYDLGGLEDIGSSTGLAKRLAEETESIDKLLERLGVSVGNALEGIETARDFLPSFTSLKPEALPRGPEPEVHRIPVPQADTDRKKQLEVSTQNLEFTQQLVTVLQESRKEARDHRAEDQAAAEAQRAEDRAAAETQRAEDEEKAEERRRIEAPAIAEAQANSKRAVQAALGAIAATLFIGFVTISMGYLDWLGDEQMLGVMAEIRDALDATASSQLSPPLIAGQDYTLPPIEDQIQALCKAPRRC